MYMHESYLLVCLPCFNTMKLWTSDPNLHLSLADTTFCLLSCMFCLFVFFLSCLFAYLACLISSHTLCLPCLSRLSALCLFHTLFAYFPSVACLLVSCLCLCMYAYEARTRGVWRPLFIFLHLYFGPRSRDVDIYFPTLCACIVHDI